jgi:DNA-binding CsgD family transcriptional regulator
MSPIEDLPGLLERLYDAALDPHAWPDFLSALPQSVGVTCDHLGPPLFSDQLNAPPASVQGKYSKKHARQLALLTPHLTRAVKINRAITDARRSSLIVSGTLDALRRPIFILDRRRKVLDANSHARALLRGEDTPVHVDGLGVLHAGRGEDERILSARVTAISCASQRAMLPLRLVNRTGAPYLAWLIPIALAKNGAPGLAEDFGKEPAILLLVSPALRLVEIPPEAIQAAFGLSFAEARLASALVAGCTLGDYATRIGVSRNTARNQLIAVFDQMGTRRVTALVATIVDALGPFACVGTQTHQLPKQV